MSLCASIDSLITLNGGGGGGEPITLRLDNINIIDSEGTSLVLNGKVPQPCGSSTIPSYIPAYKEGTNIILGTSVSKAPDAKANIITLGTNTPTDFSSNTDNNSIAIGNQTRTSLESIHIGHNVTGIIGTVIIGNNSAHYSTGITIGNNCTNYSEGAIQIGHKNNLGDGNSWKERSILIGNNIEDVSGASIIIANHSIYNTLRIANASNTTLFINSNNTYVGFIFPDSYKPPTLIYSTQATTSLDLYTDPNLQAIDLTQLKRLADNADKLLALL